jgi:hypothetical protein
MMEMCLAVFEKGTSATLTRLALVKVHLKRRGHLTPSGTTRIVLVYFQLEHTHTHQSGNAVAHSDHEAPLEGRGMHGRQLEDMHQQILLDIASTYKCLQVVTIAAISPSKGKNCECLRHLTVLQMIV